MNKNLLLGICLLPLLSHAQVGVNTPTPASTLDITAKNATGTTGNVDGLLIPRVTRERAQSMANVPISTLIYVYEITTGTQTLTAVNIDSVGHYFFNGTVWVKLNTSAGAPLSTNIYNSDGTLNSNRVVTQGTNTLDFSGYTGTATNAFSVDGSTFSVDAVNNRVGIGTTTPAGLVNIVADNVGGAAGNDFYFDGFGTSNYPVFFIGSAAGTAAAPTNLINGTQIGGLIFKPRVNGGWSYNSAGFSSTYKGNGTTDLTDLRFNTSATTRAIIDENGNMGIGTTTPAAKLDIAGTIKITDGTQAANRVLTSDANGLASWKNGPFTPGLNTFGTAYASAGGGAAISYNNGAGWVNNTSTDILLNEVSDPNNVYDPATGLITINTEGVYYVSGTMRLSNNIGTPTSPFDGNSGNFIGYVQLKPSGGGTFSNILSQNINVMRGVTNSGGTVIYDLIMSGMVHLNVGDQVKLQFLTYGTNNMNNAPANIILDRAGSSMKLFKF